MDADHLRAFLLKLPHVVETLQWGDNLVLWVGDKAVGGKMFALIPLDSDFKGVVSYAAGAERYAELLETEGLIPAPYLARASWICAERWDVFRQKEWEQELSAAHLLTLAKLSPRVRKVLDLPPVEQQRVIEERRKILQTKTAAPKPAKSRLT